jgi:hypothetical protein
VLCVDESLCKPSIIPDKPEDRKGKPYLYYVSVLDDALVEGKNCPVLVA